MCAPAGEFQIESVPFGVLLGCAALLVVGNAAADRPPTPPSDASVWSTYNGPYSGDRFSPLDQINESNADKLREVCRVRVGELGSFEAGIVVADGRMYVTTPTATLALDPATC